MSDDYVRPSKMDRAVLESALPILKAMGAYDTAANIAAVNLGVALDHIKKYDDEQ
jgi:hypothetical protein